MIDDDGIARMEAQLALDELKGLATMDEEGLAKLTRLARTSALVTLMAVIANEELELMERLGACSILLANTNPSQFPSALKYEMVDPEPTD